MDKLIKYNITFSYFDGIGPIKYQLLLKKFKDIEKAYFATFNDLSLILGERIAKNFIDFKKNFKTDSMVNELYKKNIQIIYFGHKEYPKNLVQIYDPPICLYCIGNINLLNSHSKIAIVGTRTPTSYGETITKLFTQQLSTFNFTIISGLAMGIDTISHLTCINNNGNTIAVLGSSVDKPYPHVNTQLYQNIIKNNGLIISEIPNDKNINKGMFVTRNRIISGISDAVIIIEGSEKSGALITAKYALDQGKNIYAPPSPITSRMSFAPNLLIKNGAIPLTEISDILNDDKNNQSTKLENKKLPDSPILKILQNEALAIDEITLKTKISINEVIRELTQFELLDLVYKNKEEKYELK